MALFLFPPPPFPPSQHEELAQRLPLQVIWTEGFRDNFDVLSRGLRIPPVMRELVYSGEEVCVLVSMTNSHTNLVKMLDCLPGSMICIFRLKW